MIALRFARIEDARRCQTRLSGLANATRSERLGAALLFDREPSLSSEKSVLGEYEVTGRQADQTFLCRLTCSLSDEPARIGARELWQQVHDEEVPRYLSRVVKGDPFPGFLSDSYLGLLFLIFIVDDVRALHIVLGEFDIEDFELEVEPASAIATVSAIAKAVCPECGASGLEFFWHRNHELPDDQLACAACGGMFSVIDLAGD